MKLKGFTHNNNIILYLHYSCVILPTRCYFECAVYAIVGSQNRISGQWSGVGNCNSRKLHANVTSRQVKQSFYLDEMFMVFSVEFTCICIFHFSIW